MANTLKKLIFWFDWEKTFVSIAACYRKALGEWV